FIKKLNEVVFEYYPDALMIAEESTDWPFVTWPTSSNGLGCNYKWNMGWMNDTLKYVQLDFSRRKQEHRLLTFSLVYAFSEKFILPFSHDEVVHEKKSLIEKMPGDYWQKFSGLRVLFLYYFCHPGKKLAFMGSEFAQFIEWKYDSALDWQILDFDMHRKFKEYVKSLNYLYLGQKAMWENDFNWDGFEWIDANDNEQSILIFIRKAVRKINYLVVIINFSVDGYENFKIGIPEKVNYKEIFNTDSINFGGSGKTNSGTLVCEKELCHKREYSIKIKIPPLGGVILKPCAE
ncbi:MAG: alpha amylase C-terminal domain-containing protein, partial [Eubacteriales bacterium]